MGNQVDGKTEPAGVRTLVNVQCRQCGNIAPFDPDYRICIKCGNRVQEDDTVVLRNPRRGIGMQAWAILGFLIFLAVFVFYSKYIGGYGMAVGALFYVWGLYRAYWNKKQGKEEDVGQG
jgi:hypothetical protein